MNPQTREKLMGVSAATLCTALFKRGLRNQFIQDVRPVSPKGRNMVGPAFTLRYIPAREDLNETRRSSATPIIRSVPASSGAPKAASWSWTAATIPARLPPARSSSRG